MNWLKQQLWQMPQPELIVHIGAGLCSELDDYQQIQPKKIVLVEPNPETVADLRARVSTLGNVTVIPAAVAETAGRAPLYQYNLPDLDSLEKATGPDKLFPGLREIGRIDVEKITVQQLLDQLPLKKSGQHWLVLEVFGQENRILKNLQAFDALQRFSRVIVRIAGEGAGEASGPGASGVLPAMEELGYLPVSQPETADPDWPRHHLHLDRMALECKRLKAALSEKSKQAEEQENRRKELKEEITRLKEKRDSLESGAAALKEKLAQAEAENKALKEFKEQQTQALEQERDHRERLEKQQATMKQELHKAEAQISILTELWKDAN